MRTLNINKYIHVFTGFLCHFSGCQVLGVRSEPEGDGRSDHTEEKTHHKKEKSCCVHCQVRGQVRKKEPVAHAGNSTHVSFGSRNRQKGSSRPHGIKTMRDGRSAAPHVALTGRDRPPVTSVLPDVDEEAGGEADPL